MPFLHPTNSVKALKAFECYSNNIITRISTQTAGLTFSSTSQCSYRVRDVDGSGEKHSTVESYMASKVSRHFSIPCLQSLHTTSRLFWALKKTTKHFRTFLDVQQPSRKTKQSFETTSPGHQGLKMRKRWPLRCGKCSGRLEDELLQPHVT